MGWFNDNGFLAGDNRSGLGGITMPVPSLSPGGFRAPGYDPMNPPMPGTPGYGFATNPPSSSPGGWGAPGTPAWSIANGTYTGGMGYTNAMPPSSTSGPMPGGPGGVTSTTAVPTPSSGGFVGGMAFPGAGGASTTASGGGGDLRSQVIALANQVGRPDIAANPDYWVQQIADKGQGPGGANGPLDTGYWSDRFRTANGGIGGGASSGGAAGGLGAFLQPFTGQFTPPTGTDDPGFQFALKQGTDNMQRTAAAKGNLLTGGFQKDLANYTTGAALQDYAGAYNRALSTFGTNYGIFKDNQDRPFNKLFDVTGMGLNATNAANNVLGGYGNNLSSLASSYNTNQGNQTISQGNIGAQNTANQYGGLANAAGAFASNPNWYQSLHNPWNRPTTGSNIANFGGE